MHAFGILLLAASATGDGFGYSDPGVRLKKWLRPHAVVSADAPGPPTYTAQGMGGQGGPMGAAPGRRFVSTRSQIYFLDPDGMQIGWQSAAGPNGERAYLPAQLTVPARYNFAQGYIYRLKITNIPGRPGAALYPTLEVAPTTPATDAYLAHNAIPVQFTDEDFQQVLDGGNFVTKVIYLPDPRFQELAVSGVETLVSTRLEPGVDPIIEADKRGTILLIVRLGAIDLEMPGGGSVLSGTPGGPSGPGGPMVGGAPGAVMTQPVVTGGGVTTELPPGALPPGIHPGTAAPNTVILDTPAGAAAPAPAAVPAPAPAAAPQPNTPAPAT
ncbi:MAG: hypothetical protein ACYC61_07680, partial [Isosphaeraceae bacterium]